ncbi:Alpha-1 3-glucosyltransferase [Paragonimus heterotremus]|uniref:Alpha-1 3-glucosyltransferase n=1 Tax=Paragonimus heterotremus TaxID=100268 RepID=A0A8J4SSR0_9TREM|nr:Alpha-1 3-glucosyltransferase [Paragonimus heterotremus]
MAFAFLRKHLFYLIASISSLLAIAVPKYSSLAFYVTTLGHFSLTPLIPTLAETPAVVSMFLAFTSVHWLILFRLHQTGTPPAKPQTMIEPSSPVTSLARAHLLGLIPLYVCCFFIWPLTNLHERLPFVPLLATSVYTALGLCLAFLYFLYMSTFSPRGPVPVATKVATTMEKAISSRKKNKKMKTQ